MIELRGIRFIVAAKILGEIGDVGRLRSKGSFAMLTGTAPLEASSGRTKLRDAEKKIARLTWAVSNGHLARDCRIVSSPVPPSRRMIN